jgi:hypothetical protein
MNDVVINLLFTLAGAFFGRLAALAKPRKDLPAEVTREHLKTLTSQLIAHQKLERVYAEAMEKATGRPFESVLEEQRDRIAAQGFARPDVTEAAVRDIMRTQGLQ